MLIIEIVEAMPETRAENHFGGQLTRSATAPALNYGEAQSGESRRDFIHKIKIVLKELRESSICLKIISLQNPESKCLFQFFLMATLLFIRRSMQVSIV